MSAWMGSPGTMWMIRKLTIRIAKMTGRAQPSRARRKRRIRGARSCGAARLALRHEKPGQLAHIIELVEMRDRGHQLAAAHGAEHRHDEGHRLLLELRVGERVFGCALGERDLPREASAVDEAK